MKVLLVIHPKGISDKAQYAIDQFVLRGGKLIAFLDPQSAIASRQQNPMMGGMAAASSIAGQIAEGLGPAVRHRQGRGRSGFQNAVARPERPADGSAGVAGADADGINRDDIATSQIDNVWLPMCGAFTGKPAAGLKETVLLHSTKDAELVDAMHGQHGRRQRHERFQTHAA